MHNKIKAHYIMTPTDDLLGPTWQSIIAGTNDGHKIVCVALMLRSMAAQCSAGGLLCHPNGEPLNMIELSAALRVDALWLEPVLTGPLCRAGLMMEDESGGWRSTDPVLIRHCSRIAQFQTVLPAPVELPGLVLDAKPRLETPAERKKREGRNRQRLHSFRQRWGCEPTETLWQDVKSESVIMANETPNEDLTLHTKPLDKQENNKTSANKCIDPTNDKAEAIVTNAATLPQSIIQAINSLPINLQHNAEQVATELLPLYGDAWIAANYLHLSKKNKIEPAWLRISITEDYAGASPEAIQRRAGAERAKEENASQKNAREKDELDRIIRESEAKLSTPDVIAAESRFLAEIHA